MKRPIILLVDDEPLISMMIEAEFTDAGFVVHSATNAREAAEKLDELHGELNALVTDIRLGEGPNGWSVAVDARVRLPNLPVVFVTGDSATEWTAFGVPRSVLVQKPFVAAQVMAAVVTLRNASASDA